MPAGDYPALACRYGTVPLFIAYASNVVVLSTSSTALDALKRYPPDNAWRARPHFRVRIDTIQPDDAEVRRYATLFTTATPTTEGDAIDLAMQYGTDIVDGNVQASGL